ncbi:MAG TPA: hypothetical protein VMJ93_17470 [Verrucomicrobiae bacterium]|nr:hypothetical protein [Verrucomicrobiae bacterium]
MVTDAPIAPEVGERLEIVGVAITVKTTPALAFPETVTTTLPVVAPLGTGAVMLVLVQLVGVAVVPLNLTVLLPWVDPKVVPVIVIAVPTVPEVGDRPIIFGMTVKLLPLLDTPKTLTTTLPVVASEGTGTTMLVEPQVVGVAATPLNVTVLLPWVDPKFEPLIVMDVPTIPDVGDKLEMLGLVAHASEGSRNRKANARINAGPHVLCRMDTPPLSLLARLEPNLTVPEAMYVGPHTHLFNYCQ